MKVFFILIATLIFYVLARKWLGFYIITSNSMMPTILAGDVVIITKKDEYAVGDIIAFRLSKKSIVTHRIVFNRKRVCRTKGDANRDADPYPVLHDDIYGSVILIIHTSIFFR